MAKNYFSSLRDLITQVQDDNWEQELSSEQFCALILAYNEKLSGKRRESDKLTEAEMTALELAFKSEVGGNFSKKDIANKIKVLCKPEVAEIVDGGYSRKETLTRLHSMASDKFTQKLKNYSEESKFRVQDDAAKKEDSILNDGYKNSCDQLDLLTKIWLNPEKYMPSGQQSSQALDLAKSRMEALTQIYLEEMCIGVFNRVSCVVDQEAINNVRIEEPQAV